LSRLEGRFRLRLDLRRRQPFLRLQKAVDRRFRDRAVDAKVEIKAQECGEVFPPGERRIEHGPFYRPLPARANAESAPKQS
jgi:hypothetical protein